MDRPVLRRAFRLVVSAAVLSASFVPNVSAEAPAPIDQQLRDALGHASAAEAAALVAYRASVAQTGAMEASVAAIDRQIAAMSSALDGARTKLADAQRVLDDSEAARQQVQRALDVERRQLEARAVFAYVGGNAGQTKVEAALGTAASTSVESGPVYAALLMDEQLSAVERVRRIEAEAAAVRDRFRAAEQAVRSEHDAIFARERELVAARAEAERLRADHGVALARQQALVAEIRSHKQAYLDRIHALRRESDGITVVLRATQANQVQRVDLPRVQLPLDRPVVVESTFGQRLHPVFLDYRMHIGVDFDGVIGQPVRSAGAGVVVHVALEEGYGTVVAIDHGEQVATVYAHMSSSSVKVGATVSTGQLIGKIGSSGYSTGPHLHFEYRVGGQPIDPMPYLVFG